MSDKNFSDPQPLKVAEDHTPTVPHVARASMLSSEELFAMAADAVNAVVKPYEGKVMDVNNVEQMKREIGALTNTHSIVVSAVENVMKVVVRVVINGLESFVENEFEVQTPKPVTQETAEERPIKGKSKPRTGNQSVETPDNFNNE